MNVNLAKFSSTILAFGLVAGCGEKEATTAAPDSAQAPAEVSPTAPVAELVPVTFVAFDAPPPATAAGSHCELDVINGASAIDASAKVGDQVNFGGWIADADNQVPNEARLVLKSADKAYFAPLVAGVERADVAAAYQAESLKLSGYNVLATLDVLPGTYELSIVHGPADAPVSCALKGSLAVTN